MSMIINFVQVTPKTFNLIKENEELLTSIFFEENGLLPQLEIQDEHLFEVDYLIIHEALEQMAEVMGEELEDDAVMQNLNVSGYFDYDAGYGEAFFLTPSAVKKAFEESFISHLDEYNNFEKAAASKNYIIGIIS